MIKIRQIQFHLEDQQNKSWLLNAKLKNVIIDSKHILKNFVKFIYKYYYDYRSFHWKVIFN